MVIGTAAYCGSGQDVLGDSISHLYGYKKYSMGDIIRKIAHEQGRPTDRTTLRQIRSECDEHYGKLYFPKIIVENIRESEDKDCIITGIRTVEELEMFKYELPFRLIFLNAKEEIRLRRMLRRKAKKDESTIDALKRQMDVECKTFDYEDLEKAADLYFDFSMELEQFKENESDIVKKIMKELGI